MKAPDSLDVLRSINRWFGMLLPAPWDIEYSRTDVTRRPGAFVVEAGPRAVGGSAYVRDMTQDYQAFLYPSGVRGDATATKIEAHALAVTVERALSQGLKVSGAYYSYSMRIPLYDYEGIDADEGQPDGALPIGYLALRRSFTVDPRPDPEQDDLYTVVVGFTGEWRDDGDVRRHEGPVLESVETTPVEP